MILQHPEARTLVQLRADLARITAEHDLLKARFIAQTVETYLAERPAMPPMKFRVWLHDVVQDPALEEDVWAATLPHLSAADFAGWYMLRKDGADIGQFQMDTPRAASSYVRQLRTRDPQATYTYVPLADALPLSA
jgi:hypothetical protein